MTEPHEHHEPASVADLHDRLIDRALAETLGRETPPDLAARILAHAAEVSKVGSRSSKRWQTTFLAVAATLAIAVTIALSQIGSYRKAAVWSSASAKIDRVAAAAKPSEGAIVVEGLVIDASTPNRGLNRELREQSRTSVRDRGVEVSQRQSSLAGVEVLPSLTEEASGDRYAATSSRKIGLQTTGKAKAPVNLGYRWNQSGDQSRNWSQLDENLYAQQLQLSSGDKSIHFWADPDLGPVAGVRRKYFRSDLGTGPGTPGDQYTRINENPFIQAAGGDAVSTFSIDVDTASYANLRQFLMDMRQLPPPDAVRIEELVNYFDYDYAGPNSDDEAPFAAHVEVAGCPWAPEHRLVRIGIKGREIKRDKRPPSNLVFLVDVSGSMDEPNKLPLVVDGLRQLTRELGENDCVAIVVYASSEGLALESTRGDHQAAILGALDRLRAGGSTAGGAGIQLAYQIAEDHFIPGGTNRVVLCTDGDFNVGVTSTAELERLVTKKARETGVFLSVLGFGRGNLNDAMMQTIADRGNGNHYYVDNLREARKVLVEEMTGTLVTIAKDVKIQVEFNPVQVAGYRLLGYENRLLRTEDFNDDRKDAGEIGAGHTVTALYEVIPAGKPFEAAGIDELKYQASTKSQAIAAVADVSGELLTLKMRYKQPSGETSRKLEWPIVDTGAAFSDATDDFQFAAAVASFGLLLRDSQYKGETTCDTVAEIAASSLGNDSHGYRAEFVELVGRAKELRPSR
jgi:Ca-activated chloride channel family protein